jgi:hypothetical protein
VRQAVPPACFFLLNKSNRLQTEVRILTVLNQSRRMLDRFAKTDVVATNPQQFATRLVVFNDLKPQRHRIESPGKKRLIPKRVKVWCTCPRCHKFTVYSISATDGLIVSTIVMQSTYGENRSLLCVVVTDKNGLCDIVDHASEKGVYRHDGISGCDLAERSVRPNVPPR